MILRRKKRRRTGVVAALCLGLAACASTSGAPQSQQASLLQSQHTVVVPHFDQSQQASLLLSELTRIDVSHSERSIYYLGLALYSETWSQNDVVDLAEELSASVPTVPPPGCRLVFITPSALPKPVSGVRKVGKLLPTGRSRPHHHRADTDYKANPGLQLCRMKAA